MVVTRPDLCRQAALQADVAFASLDLEDTNVTDVKLPAFSDFQTANVGGKTLKYFSLLSKKFPPSTSIFHYIPLENFTFCE